jgi:hypothetical protein
MREMAEDEGCEIIEEYESEDQEDSFDPMVVLGNH